MIVINEENVRQIIHKYLQGEATDQERALLENWYFQQGQRHPIQEKDLLFLLDSETIFEGVRRRAGLTTDLGCKKPPHPRRWFNYAAALLVLSLPVTWIFHANEADILTETVDPKLADVMPSGNRALLTLADGRQINLSDTQSGIVVGEDHISYEEDEDELIGLEVGQSISLELSVPRGSIYQITLADGTKVWLNADSKLKYPSRFDTKERVVVLEGEAYFSVTKGQSTGWPFRVMAAGQMIEVLGTDFNVSAYTEEPRRTTLVAGSVEVTNVASGLSNLISPGQQAVVSGTAMNVVTVDVFKHTAWKEGLFYFKHTPFDELIREIARWYDLKVVYKGPVPKETFSGKMRRGLSLMTVLGLLDVSTKAELHLKDRELIIR